MGHSMPLSRVDVDELLWMYRNPADRYLLETTLDFPVLKSKLWFSPDATNAPKDEKNEITSGELSDICSQSALLLYRQALLDNHEDFPKLSMLEIDNLHKILLPVREHVYQKIFRVPRTSDKYNITAKHLEARKSQGNYFLKYSVAIDNFFGAYLEKEIHLSDKHKYSEGKISDIFDIF